MLKFMDNFRQRFLMRKNLRCGAFQHIYNPSVGKGEKWYINDHCFIQGPDGLWHMFGITQKEPAKPLEERFFAHATSPGLTDGTWVSQRPVLHVDEERGETHVWAPHVVEHENVYYMFYCAGGEDHSAYRIHVATSKDLWQWERHEANPLVVDGFDARDPMVLRVGDEWVMYYTANSSPEGGEHVVAAVTSQDLLHWGNKQVVFQSHSHGTYAGPTESPFVVKRGKLYYLFVCTNAPYNTSAVYVSENPFHWEKSQQVGWFPSHASEVVMDREWCYISRAGWGQGGVYLAPLHWKDDLSDPSGGEGLER
ncbi:MAG: hypothetical protein MI717_11755 [Spirochaetales bacterium]|nr:hypothetical protein [Spirochaetales bacterium]